MSENTDFNVQMQNIEPITLVNEFSSTEYYIGVSNNGSDTSKPIWLIRKISKVADVWAVTQYPDGNQTFEYIWDSRFLYTYK